jgi:ribonuclease HI
LWPYVAAFVLFSRIGEAANPGPRPGSSFVLGAFNPSGLPGKAPYLVSQLAHGDIWAVSETHLSEHAMSQFRASMHFARGPYKYMIGGHPVPAQTDRTFHASRRGVATISKHPTRAVPTHLPDDVLGSSRALITTSLIQDTWVTGGVVYGEPESSTYPQQKHNNERLLQEVANHVCCLTTGPRYVAGDWNVSQYELPVFAQMEAAGFLDLQDVTNRLWGVPIQPTCKGVTRKDYLYISPELQQLLHSVEVHQDVFPDHAVILGVFHPMKSLIPKQIWFSPTQFPWPSNCEMDEHFWQTTSGTCEQRYAALWQHIETTAARCVPFPVPKNARGRARTMTTSPVVAGKVPAPRLARKGDVQPQYVCSSFRYAQWLRQTRRLQAYCRYAKGNDVTSHHACLVWGAIVRARGFNPSFSQWWKDASTHTHGAPVHIPLIPPVLHVATHIYESMSLALRQFEIELQKTSRLYARLKRDSNPNSIFHDLKTHSDQGVQVLLQPKPAKVIEVRPDEMAIVLDRPMQFDLTVPVVWNAARLPVIHAEHDCVWVESLDGVEVGGTIMQTCKVGTDEDLFHTFLTAWKEMWERHTHVPPQRWTPILEFARQHLPRLQHTLPQMTVETLHHCLSHKKTATASGLDGVSLTDLRAMPPAALSNFVDIFAHAEETGLWPSQIVSGRVACIAKIPEPQKALDFRPVTVLGLLYRCWGTFNARHIIQRLDAHLPTGLFGSRPQRFAGQVWSQLLWSIEQAYEHGIQLSGIIADIQKAFNYLPRLVVFECCALVGIPFHVLRAWAGALTIMPRRFQINGALSPPAYSNCGLPEGCALSCVGMMVIDMVYHAWMSHFFPMCQPLSYVDDWQVLMTNPDFLQPALQCLDRFTQEMDLLLDRRKTHTWSVSANGRQLLREQGLDLVACDRNLGAHVQFTRLHTNCTLVARIQGAQHLWLKLRISACNYLAKVRAIRVAAWPKFLHGIPATTLSLTLFKSLRSGAMRGLRAEAAGANPIVQLGLIENSATDPHHWAIQQTIRLTRDCGQRERVEQVLAEIVAGSNAFPSNSITHTLCTRLQFLGWHINDKGMIVDFYGTFSLFAVSMAELQYRLDMQWPRVVAASTAHRRCFEGLENCDVADTRRWLQSLDAADQALFRKVLNGTHFTQDGKMFCQEASSDECLYCACSDSRYHRFWECPRFETLREGITPAVRRCISELPESLSCSGWSLQPTTLCEWNSYFAGLPILPIPSFTFHGDMYIFTDGSCFNQQVVNQRFAGYAVVSASCKGVYDCQGSEVLDAGPLPGILQSAIRAEIFAVLRALQIAEGSNERLFIWSDCDSVIKKLKRILSGHDVRVNCSHTDLWLEIQTLARARAGPLFAARVAAHQRNDEAGDIYADWCFRHNGVADRQAVRANVSRSQEFWELWQQHTAACEGIAWFNQTVQQVQLAISQEATREDAPMSGVPPAHLLPHVKPSVSWTALPTLFLPPTAIRWYGDKLVRHITSWFWAAVQNSDHEVQWVSHFQLYIDFMLTTGLPGPIKRERWYDGADLPFLSLRNFAFRQRARWFTKVFKETLRHMQIKLSFDYTRPASQMVLMFTGVIALPWCPQRLQWIDDWMLSHGGNTFRRQSAAIDSLPFAEKSPQFPPHVLTSLGT